MELRERNFLSFSKSEIKIEKALQAQVKTIIDIKNTIENNSILLATQNHKETMIIYLGMSKKTQTV